MKVITEPRREDEVLAAVAESATSEVVLAAIRDSGGQCVDHLCGCACSC